MLRRMSLYRCLQFEASFMRIFSEASFPAALKRACLSSFMEFRAWLHLAIYCLNYSLQPMVHLLLELQ
jgi:hypothetical protein